MTVKELKALICGINDDVEVTVITNEDDDLGNTWYIKEVIHIMGSGTEETLILRGK